jgi:hypothetical protein
MASMSVHTKTCVWVQCDGPSRHPDHTGWDDEGPFHFDTEAAALDWVLGEDGAGWTRLPDGRLLCRTCSEEADCAATGHQWSSWHLHHTDPRIEWRTCYHCGGQFEERFVEMGGQP